MERGKGGTGRGGKSKAPQHPANFIPLGSKAGGSRPDLTEPKRPTMAPKIGAAPSAPGSSERKREALGPTVPIPPAKKAKLDSPMKGEETSWDANALECDPADLVATISQAMEADDVAKARSLLCGGLWLLRKGKADKILTLSLLLVGKQWPQLLTAESGALCSFLRSKIKSQAVTLAATLLMKGLQDLSIWPEALARAYVEDAAGEHLWVDLDEAKPLVDNIVASFGTKQLQKLVIPSEIGFGRSESPGSDDEAASARKEAAMEGMDTGPVLKRYKEEVLEGIVMATVQEHLGRRQPQDSVGRNLLKLMATASGLLEVRLSAASKLDLWLQNPKLLKASQELLLSVCANCSSSKDTEVVGHLVKMRPKSKAILNLYLSGIRELIAANGDNLGLVLKLTIYNELSNSRNTNNMSVIAVVFQTYPEQAAVMLAEVFHELLMNREDYLKPLRLFLRELVRMLRAEMPLVTFCRTLMRDRSKEQTFRDFGFKERMLAAIADLVCLCVLLGISPAVREAASLIARGERKEVQTMINYQNMAAKIQRDSVWWLHETVIKMYHPSAQEFVHILHKVLFLEQGDQYHGKDNWPPENDRGTMYRLASEVPVFQNTLLRLNIIGLSKEHPISCADLLDIEERIIKRAASIASEQLNPLLMDKTDLLDVIFDLCSYRHPDNITLPVGYCPPRLAISNLYWKVWCLLVVIAAFNPATVGATAWEKYATLRAFMEMCITNHFRFPPPTMALLEEDAAKEAQTAAHERTQILEFETHLAAASTKATITEHTSLLLPQLTSFDPIGPARRPPAAVLASLQALNNQLHLGHRLCRSRNPDFLLDVIQRQGTSQAMPWLADLVESSEGALSHLPVQCLCEFLLSDTAPLAEQSRQQKQQQLVGHLRGLLVDKDGLDAASQCCEVLEYFLRRLGSPQACSRHQAIKGLRLLLEEEEEDGVVSNWLLERLPALPHFAAVRPQAILALRQACLTENNIPTLRTYLRFLADHSTKDAALHSLADLALDMAQLVVERNNITHLLLPSRGQLECEEAQSSLAHLMHIFTSYLQKAREPRREAYVWSDSQDHILVQWPSGEECTLQILVVHASVMLLTYGQGRQPHLFFQLMDIWLGPTGPRAFLVDTSEEALLIPDWLKLKMIQSEAPGLVDAALTDLEPPQLLLFAQNFGIPSENMGKLLATLDRAVQTEPQAVADALQDRTYMVQLVRVQHFLGAQNGHKFLQFLDSTPQQPDEVAMEEVEEELRPPLPEVEEKKPVLKAVDSMVPSLFSEDGSEARAAFNQIHKTVCKEVSQGESPLLLTVIRHVVREIRNRPSFAHYALSRPLLLWPLLRLAVTMRPNPALKEALLQLAELLKATKQATPLTHMLAAPKPKVEGPKEKQPSVAEVATHKLLHQEPGDSTGRLLDSLATIETVPIEQQMQLLFGRGHTTCRPYLLTLLTHSSTWKTLHNCMTQLLQERNPSYDSSAVLDFLWALIGNPKLWQGREKRPSKHQSRDDILCLNQKQTCVLLDYVLDEALSSGQDLSDSRVSLILQCLPLAYLPKLVRHLAATLQSPETSTVGRQLLLQLYLAVPVLITHLSDSEKDVLAEGTINGPCALDIPSHSLLSALASSSGSAKDWSRRSHDYELAARKMTATHPLLVLRQLPMLGTSLRGRVHFESSVFRNRNHLIFFMQVLGLLEILQPHIFQMEYAQSLELILDSFFAMFHLHNQLRDVQIALNRTVALLQSFVSYDAQRALKYLQRHCQLLHDLHAAYPGVSGLQPLLAGLSLPARDGDDPEVLVAAAAVGAVENQQPTAMVGQIVGRLGKQQSEDVQQQALQDLDHTSLRRQAILEGCVDLLAGLLLHPSNNTRSLAHTLLLRYLRYNPGAASASVTTFVHCLDSSNPDIQASAIERIPEVVVCAQEHALTILKKLGKLGIEQGVNTTSVILRAVSLLQLQNGC
ncbi:integrator complex subunit 1 [Neocloeon triangulifer]|uniref:integrator complex subunit 1 n=1 Tax=Neocloeon triangulifer TaxID=2078957 RepID=UPI00286F1AA2|nr:integrator complex subunit 1 [Neocloeon triangulifer]